TSALTALAQKCGFNITSTAVLPDDRFLLEQTIKAAMECSSIVVVSGGSSHGEKDMTRSLIDQVSSPGVFTHGLAVKPGKPTILGFDNFSRTLLVGLPGHPVAAMMVFELLLCWLKREVAGSKSPPAIPAKVSCNVASSPGKLTCWPVVLKWTDGGYLAEPVFGKSGLITTLAKADGYFTITRNKEGVLAGETVLVHLF
ncbi:MAG: molybdopterin-binding protein, partial [Clostridiales bacterium]|nr:molybdopterin-binding protein [Clostridiales bacterium]